MDPVNGAAGDAGVGVPTWPWASRSVTTAELTSTGLLELFEILTVTASAGPATSPGPLTPTVRDWIVTSETTTLLTFAGAWSATGGAVVGIAVGVTSWDTLPPLGAGTMPREGVVADGVGFGTGVWVAAPPTAVVGLGLRVLAADGAGEVVETTSLGVVELATGALESGVSAGALVAELSIGEELAVLLSLAVGL